ncbi:hypothetical protein [Parafrankia sp. FMc2]|uniref:hypothetical protein n=1 Tax=Parafrankia sp. FMc2 TaxID=3233196 RepID=UPI0034D6484D
MSRPVGPAAGGGRLFVLLAWTAPVGAALTPVGVLGVDGERWRVSWLPVVGTDHGRIWRDRLAGRATAPDGALLSAWMSSTTASLVELPAPSAPSGTSDLSRAVEAAVDELLVPPDPPAGGQGAGGQ